MLFVTVWPVCVCVCVRVLVCGSFSAEKRCGGCFYVLRLTWCMFFPRASPLSSIF